MATAVELADELIAAILDASPVSAVTRHGLCTCRADSLDGSFVFRSKAFAQVHAPAPARVSPGRQRGQQDDADDNDEHEGV